MTLLKKNLRPAYVFIVLTALAFLFSMVYTVFTYGETTVSLSYAWVFLLCSGAVFFVLAALILSRKNRRMHQLGLEVYSTGVLTYTAGMAIRGLFEILGDDRSLIKYYEIAGIGLMVAGFILIAFFSRRFSGAHYSITELFDLFMNEHTLEKEFELRITARELYSRYLDWTFSKGYDAVSMRRFAKKLKTNYKVMPTWFAKDVVLGLAFRDVR